MADDEECIGRLRELVAALPAGDCKPGAGARFEPPMRPATDLYELLPEDHRAPYDMLAVLDTVSMVAAAGVQAEHAAELICGTGAISGIPVG